MQFSESICIMRWTSFLGTKVSVMRGFQLKLHPRQRHQLQRAERSHPLPRVRWRARLVLACAKTTSLRQVATAFDCSWRAVKEAVRRYRQGRVRALADAPRPGRPRKVPPRVRETLGEALEMTPTAAGVGGWVWTVKRVRRYLKRAHQTEVSLTTAWTEIHRCRRRRKRGKGYISSPDSRYAQKKGSWSAPVGKRESTAASRSGMKTRVRSICCLCWGQGTGRGESRWWFGRRAKLSRNTSS